MAKQEQINANLTLEALLERTEGFVEGIISQDEFSKWGETLIVKAALPMLDKLSLLMDIIEKKEYSSVESQEILICELYKNIFFYVYLGGYLGVEDIKDEDVTYTNYDLLEPIFGPWIESFAGRDIEIFKSMLKDSINLYDTINMNKAITSVDSEKILNATESNKELINYIANNKDVVRDLKDLSIMNNPLTHEVIETIKEKAINQVKQQ